jgi:hypothetical protein
MPARNGVGVLAAAVLIAASACVSDQRFIADQTAAQLYYADRYGAACEILPHTRPDCSAFYEEQLALTRDIRLAAVIYEKTGRIAPEHRKAIAAARKKVKARQ